MVSSNVVDGQGGIQARQVSRDIKGNPPLTQGRGGGGPDRLFGPNNRHLHPVSPLSTQPPFDPVSSIVVMYQHAQHVQAQPLVAHGPSIGILYQDKGQTMTRHSPSRGGGRRRGGRGRAGGDVNKGHKGLVGAI